MKGIFSKKRTNKPSTGETVSHFNDEEYAEKECEVFNAPKSSENYFSPKNLASGNLKTFSLHFDNPEFSEYDSNIFSLGSSQNSAISTSKSVSGTFAQSKEMGYRNTAGSDLIAPFSEVSGCKSKNHLSQRSEKQTKSDDSMSRPSENLLLRKTEEISDFNFKKFNEFNMIKDNSFQCTVERLVLAKEKRARRSDLCARDTEMNLFSEIDLTESQSGDCNKISNKLLRCSPFRHRRSVKKRPIESQDEKKDEGFWSKKSFFNKARLVNFLFGKNENTFKRSEITELSMTEKGDAKPKLLKEIFVDPKVPLEEDLETKQYFKDLFFYTIYLVLITAIAMSMVSAGMYYFANITASLFMDSENTPSSNRSGGSLSGPPRNDSKYGHKKTLRTSHTFDDFWDFAESTMIDLFYWNFFNLNTDAHTKKDDKKMFYENQILGVPRLRQVRVRNNSCSIHRNVKRFFDSCYYYYSPFTEETRPIKRGMETSSTATAWVYTKAENLNTSYYWGEISVYGGGGYYLDLDQSKEKTKEMIEELRQNLWLSRATRALFMDFNLYNANVNLFCLCKIVLEFPPVGGIIPKADFHALKLIRYLTTFDFFILGCEFLLIMFLFYFTWKLFKNGIQQKNAFFLSFWNYLDLIIVLLLCAFFILSIIRYTLTNKLIRMLDDRFSEYTEFDLLKKVQINFNNVIAVLLFASWTKLLTYLTFNKIMLEFRKTLQKSFIGILGFFPMFLTIYLAFALLANLLFGNEVKDYSTVWFSLLSLLQALSGEFQYSQIQESHRILGSIFIVAFIFFIFFVLLNVFIAIINDAYAKVKSEIVLIRPRVGEYAKTGITNLMTCCQLRKKFKKKASLKKKLIFSEIRKALEISGFTENEIRIFFTKYNINVHNILDKSTRRRFMEDLELNRVDFDNTSQSEFKFLRRRINNLSSRIDEMEMNLQPIIDKVDILLDRFSSKKYS